MKSWKLSWAGFVLGFVAMSGCAITGMEKDKVIIAQGSAAKAVIAVPEKADLAEQNAAAELALYLGKISGGEFKKVRENEVPKDSPAIYIGRTACAQKSGIDCEKLGPEEWVIKTNNGSLILCGGNPRGTLYAVYEFLESELGVHWFDHFSEDVPQKSDVVLDKLDKHGKPAFEGRAIYTAIGYCYPECKDKAPLPENTRKYARFLVANKLNGCFGFPPSREWGFEDRNGFYSIGSCHTLFKYLPPEKYFKEHPEYYTMRNGKRIDNDQICFTNKDVREIYKKKLRGAIEKDRAEAKAMGLPFPQIYDISVTDVHISPYCDCPECRKMFEREGGEKGGNSGIVLDFINDLADSIKDDYPDVLIQTFAYTIALDPPKTIRPRDNVMMRFADYRKESCRPLTHPHNEVSYSNLKKWAAISKWLSEWDYIITYTIGVAVPTSCVDAIGQNIPIFYKNNVRRYCAEAEDAHITSFHSLRVWLCVKMLQDPSQSPEKLIETFMKGYYGPAAETMNNYRKFLEETVAKTDQRIERPYQDNNVGYNPYNRPFINLEYLLQCDAFLNQAEKLCAPNSAHTLHVRKERIPVDNCLLVMWDGLKGKLSAGKTMPFEREKLIQRYYDCRKEQQELREKNGLRVYCMRADVKDNLDLEVAAFRSPPNPLPEQFKDIPREKIIDMGWPEFTQSYIARIVEDKDALGSKALASHSPFPLNTDKPLGIYVTTWIKNIHVLQKTIPASEIPSDGKYHLVHLGKVTLEPGLFIQTDKGMEFIPLDLVYATRKERNYDIYVSLKIPKEDVSFTSLAWDQVFPYKQGSIKTGLLVDRVILVAKD